MNAVRTPSIVLLFHSYVFYPRSLRDLFSILSSHSTRFERLAFFATYLQLCRGYDPRDGGKKFYEVRSACSSNAREPSTTTFYL